MPPQSPTSAHERRGASAGDPTHLQGDAVEDEVAERDGVRDEERAAVAQRACDGEPS